MSEANSGQVEALNKVLNGEHMAIDTYYVFINKIDDPNLKESLRSYKRDHEEHARLLRFKNWEGNQKKAEDLQGRCHSR